FRASGMSVRSWCAEQGIKEHQLRYWLRRLDSDDTQGPRWIPVTLNGAGPWEEARGLVIRIGRATIEVGPGFDRTLLADVVRVLTHCCTLPVWRRSTWPPAAPTCARASTGW